MNDSEAIEQTFEILRKHPQAEEEKMIALLHEAVGDRELAYRLFEFVPRAYAQVYHADCGYQFDDHYRRVVSKWKNSHPCPLSSEPIWEQAVAKAKEDLATERSAEERFAILDWSSTHLMIEVMRGKGVKMEGMFSPPPLRRPAPMPCSRSESWWARPFKKRQKP